MSTGVDLSQFYDMFFDEAEELLADMEQILLGVDVDQPDIDDLNAIFRAAHSIKGGAGTFGCFEHLTTTTHVLENVLDSLRKGELTLRKDMIDIFLEAKDVLTDQLAAYRNGSKPDEDAYERICQQLRELALDTGEHVVRVALTALSPSDASALEAEMDIMGTVLHKEVKGDALTMWVQTTASVSDIDAVCQFVVNASQLDVQRSSRSDFAPVARPESDSPAPAGTTSASAPPI